MPSEISSWDSLLAGGMTRQQVAAAVIAAPESTMLMVAGDYASYLHRAMDPMAMDWVDLLEAGSTTIDELAVSLLTRTEYINEVI